MKKTILLLALICLPLLASAQTESDSSSDSLLICEWYDNVFNGNGGSDDILDKYLSSELKERLWTEDYDGCYEFYRFRTAAQDYNPEEGNVSRIISISDEDNGWYEVKYLDMGYRGTTRVCINDNKIVDFVADSSWESSNFSTDEAEDSFVEVEAEPTYEATEAEKTYEAAETKDNAVETSQEDGEWSFSDIIYGLIGLLVLGYFFGKGKSSSSNGLSSLFKNIFSSSSSSSWGDNLFSYSNNQSNEPGISSSPSMAEHKQLKQEKYIPKACFEIEYRVNNSPLTSKITLYLHQDSTVSDFIRELEKKGWGKISIASYRRGNDPVVEIDPWWNPR